MWEDGVWEEKKKINAEGMRKWNKRGKRKKGISNDVSEGQEEREVERGSLRRKERKEERKQDKLCGKRAVK